jgi:hypothetical protein
MLQRTALALGPTAHRIAGRLRAEEIFQRCAEPRILHLPRRSPATLAADALRWAVGQAGGQLTLPTRNGMAVQPGDLGQPLHAAIAEACRLKSGKPAALLLIKAAEKLVDLPVQQQVGMPRA